MWLCLNIEIVLDFKTLMKCIIPFRCVMLATLSRIYGLYCNCNFASFQFSSCLVWVCISFFSLFYLVFYFNSFFFSFFSKNQVMRQFRAGNFQLSNVRNNCCGFLSDRWNYCCQNFRVIDSSWISSYCQNIFFAFFFVMQLTEYFCFICKL